MQAGVPFFPEQASTIAWEVDALYFFLVAITAFFTVLVAGLITFFAIKYRRRSESEVPPKTEENPILEITWIVVPLGISLVIFLWGAKLFFTMATPPKETIDIYVTGKQWMWKLQHLEGQREINQLHVPVGKPVKLIMTSEDVIHSFYIPAFRVKADVLPGNFTKIWFEASKPGKYHLFCAEYCGTKHSGMIGDIIVMEPAQYEEWLNGGSEGSLASTGEKLFQSLSCNTCHNNTASSRGPNLEGLFGKQVQLQDGRTVVGDEQYIRESILNPNAKITKDFPPNMPTFDGLITQDQVLQLVSYIKTLGVQADKGKVPITGTTTPTPTGTTTTPTGTATPTSKPVGNTTATGNTNTAPGTGKTPTTQTVPTNR